MKKACHTAIQIVIIGYLFSLSACIPLQTKQYLQPMSLSGKACVRQCDRQRSDCNDSSCIRSNSCDSSQQLDQDLRSLRNPSRSSFGNDPLTSKYDSMDCAGYYEDCFTECGGVVAHKSMNEKPVELLVYGVAMVALIYMEVEKAN